MVDIIKEINSYRRKHFDHLPLCCICEKEITEPNPEKVIFVKTKRKTEHWYHKSCLQKGW